MILKSAAVKTLDQAAAVLEKLERTYQPQIDAGTLTEEDRERIRRRLELANVRGRRAAFSLLGDLVDAGKRFFKIGSPGHVA